MPTASGAMGSGATGSTGLQGALRRLYGVDEEGLEAAYDAGAYCRARSTRATAASPLTTASRTTSTSMAVVYPTFTEDAFSVSQT